MTARHAEQPYDQVIDWLEHFEDLEDPRQQDKVWYGMVWYGMVAAALDPDHCFDWRAGQGGKLGRYSGV